MVLESVLKVATVRFEPMASEDITMTLLAFGRPFFEMENPPVN